MKSTNPYSIHPKHLQNAKALRSAKTPDAAGTPTPPPTASTIRTTGREYVNPVDYQHPFDSMARFANALALRYDANRTRHAYYRQVRLIHDHFSCDPPFSPSPSCATTFSSSNSRNTGSPNRSVRRWRLVASSLSTC